jgi:hypothetical protein
MPVKQGSGTRKSGKVFGQSRKTAKMFRGCAGMLGLDTRTSTCCHTDGAKVKHRWRQGFQWLSRADAFSYVLISSNQQVVLRWPGQVTGPCT